MRNSYLRCSIKTILKNFEIFTIKTSVNFAIFSRKHLCLSFFLIKEKIQPRCFPGSIQRFFKRISAKCAQMYKSALHVTSSTYFGWVYKISNSKWQRVISVQTICKVFFQHFSRFYEELFSKKALRLLLSICYSQVPNKGPPQLFVFEFSNPLCSY